MREFIQERSMLSDVGDPYLYDEECDRDGEHPIGEDLYSSSFALPSAARSDWSPSLHCYPLVCTTCDAGRNVPMTGKSAPRTGRPNLQPLCRLLYWGLSARFTCSPSFCPSLRTVSCTVSPGW